jgi:hypothetical protein
VVREDDEPDKGIGILSEGHVNIEIDHNEIYGWSHTAVRVDDCQHPKYPWCLPDEPDGKMLPSENPREVRIHDNYIHHNQHQGKLGYGVSLHNGAYALIERNVFDWNRHAIEGDGSPGAGYAAYRNLVLENGGYHDTYNACDLKKLLPEELDWLELAKALPLLLSPETLLTCLIPGRAIEFDYYTHQFDMHGDDTCFPGHWNCGTAGHSMFIRHNSFLYTRGDAIKLRGAPQLGMFVESNVFAHDTLQRDDSDVLKAMGCLGNLFTCGALLLNDSDFLHVTAVEQTATGLFTSDNLLGVNGLNEIGSCDFDGDGIQDSFLATGQTWWYKSGDMPWMYLNASTKRLEHMTLGDVNGDNICDVWVDGIVYPGGRPKQHLPGTPLSPGGGMVGAALSN